MLGNLLLLIDYYEFNMNIQSTVSSPILHLFKNYKISNEEEDDSEISIRIWDTAGQERYQSLCTNYIKKADIIVFVRDNQQEKFPIVDENGTVVGSATRGECHSGSKLLHPVVHLHVFNSQGEINLKIGLSL